MRPARRDRSITTSRACHVGLRSSCSDSSCSSTTTAHRQIRTRCPGRTPRADHDVDPRRSQRPLPRHDSDPQAAPGKCRGHRLGAGDRRDDDQRRVPLVAPRRWRRRARSLAGAQALRHRQSRRSAARRPTELVGISACPCAGGGSAVTLVGGLAATRNGRNRPAAHRIDAHSASSISAGSGPIDEMPRTG